MFNKPFSQPTHRFQGDATATTKTVAVNSSAVLDYTLTSDLMLTGGEIIYSGWQIGDYIKMEVHHPTDGLIETYIYKHFLCEHGHDALDLRPLAAPIPTGLIIRTTYYTANSGSTRTFAVNLDLFKEL